MSVSVFEAEDTGVMSLRLRSGAPGAGDALRKGRAARVGCAREGEWLPGS